MLKPVWNLRQWSFKSGIRFFDTKLENSNVFTKGILYTVCFGKFVVAWNRLVPLMPSQTIFQVSALSKLRKKAPKRVQILCNRQKEPHWEQENIFSLGFVFFEKFDSTSCCWPILDTRSDLGKQKKRSFRTWRFTFPFSKNSTKWTLFCLCFGPSVVRQPSEFRKPGRKENENNIFEICDSCSNS